MMPSEFVSIISEGFGFSMIVWAQMRQYDSARWVLLHIQLVKVIRQ